jgi:mono/diheme cytochrome c family protein
MAGRLAAANMISTTVVVIMGIASPAPARSVRGLAPGQAPPVDGSSAYKVYCASCHGEYGRGNGTVAVYLRRRPADLTQIAKRNKGVFPAERIFQLIDGRQAVKAHGDSQMPVWGDAFSIAGADEASIKTKIEAVVKHLASIQER